MDSPLEARLQARKVVYWRILQLVQEKAAAYYMKRIKAERENAKKRVCSDVDMLDPKMRDAEEKLYLKSLDAEWQLRGFLQSFFYMNHTLRHVSYRSCGK